MVIKNNHRGFHIMRTEYIMNDNKYILPEYKDLLRYLYIMIRLTYKNIQLKKNDCDDFSFIICGNFYNYNAVII